MAVAALRARGGALRSWVELYGPLTEAQDEAHLGAAIATISAAIGWKASIRWGENAEPCTVNVVLEGRSATARKTTVAAGAHQLARLAMEAVEAEDQGLRTRSISHTSNRGLLETVAAKDNETAERWETEPPPGNLLVWDEFGAVLGEPGETKGAGWLGQVRATLMQLTNGRHGGIETGGLKIPPARCAVSILATMTRAELEQRVSAGLLRDGFMGRFVLIPFSGRSRLLSAPPAWTPGMSEQRDGLVAWLRQLAQAKDGMGDIFARLTPGALAARHRWYERWVSELEARAEAAGSEEATAAVEAFGRLQTTALKLATIAAVAEWAPHQELAAVEITGEHVGWGQELAELCLEEVIALSEYGALTLRDLYAEHVKAWLTRNGETSKKGLLDAVKMQPLSREDRWKIVVSLYPEDVDLEKVETGGRPKIVVRPVGGVDAPVVDLESARKVGGNPHG